MVAALSSCRERVDNPYKELTLEAFSDLRTPEYKVNSRRIRSHIDRLIAADSIVVSFDKSVRRYYSKNNQFIWIDRFGVRDNAAIFLDVVRKADAFGLNINAFNVSQIEKDIETIKNLDVFDGGDDINQVMGRIEYNLTKAYFRYSAGLRYGFVSPDNLYNRFETVAADSVSDDFVQLCDLKALRPDKAFFKTAVSKALGDSLAVFLASVVPENELHKLLVSRLDNQKLTPAERLKTICNIERCRWRQKNMRSYDKYDKYVLVNIPSFCLRASDKGNVMIMRVGCGATDHKTPLLTSWVTRMDVNPQWIVPKSIAKSYVYRPDFMHRMGMFVYDKHNGKQPPEAASYSKIMEGKQHIIQAGGPKNSLGRIIFRFENNFSVFLHDTSSPWIFKKNQRDVSHGCVRVERPLDLALFLLGDRSEEYEDKLKYSMTVNLVNDKDSLKKEKIDKDRLVNTLSVKPAVPLFITYYTVYYDTDGRLVDFADIYGYDEVLLEKLSPFIK